MRDGGWGFPMDFHGSAVALLAGQVPQQESRERLTYTDWRVFVGF